jgi:general secretion pathway protein K
MLTVVLVATLASAMLWQQWRGVEVETAQRTRVQSVWVLTGALDWARLILREDARDGGADHLAEPWAVPLAPARLSTFLAAERGQALVADETDADQEAFLSGHIEDLQARLNLNNLLENTQLHEPTVAIWARLFKHLGLPDAELQTLTHALQRAYPDAGKDKPAAQGAAGRLLQPQSVADLPWLGLSPATLHALAPFVTVLPVRTPVNLNTAEPEVLLASVSGLNMAQAQALVQARAKRHMQTLMDAEQLVNDPKVRFDGNLHSVASRFFSVTGQLRLGNNTVQEVSVLQRDGLDVKTLSRQREMLDATMSTLQ